MANAASFLNFVGGSKPAPAPAAPPAPQRQPAADPVLHKMLGTEAPRSPHVPAQQDLEQRCNMLEAEKRSLNTEIDRLRAQVEQLYKNGGSGDRRAQELQGEVSRLRSEMESQRGTFPSPSLHLRFRDSAHTNARPHLATHTAFTVCTHLLAFRHACGHRVHVHVHARAGRFESELRSRTESIERRLRDQNADQTRHIDDLEERMRKARTEMDKLLEDNRKLKRDLEDAHRQPPQAVYAHGGTMDLSDFFPLGIELSTLKRNEWRSLFEKVPCAARAPAKSAAAPRDRATCAFQSRAPTGWLADAPWAPNVRARAMRSWWRSWCGASGRRRCQRPSTNRVSTTTTTTSRRASTGCGRTATGRATRRRRRGATPTTSCAGVAAAARVTPMTSSPFPVDGGRPTPTPS